MKYDENERIVKEALNTINTPLYDFKKEVKEKIIAKQRPILIRRRLNIGLVAIIIVILSGTVLASTLPSINKLFSIISPEMGKLLQPVGEYIKIEEEKERGDESLISEENEEREKILSVISEDIEIKPIAVINDDDMMIIYLTIQDLVGDRINETLKVEEYFVEGGAINNCQLIDYDKESKVGIIQLTAQGGEKLNNTKVSLGIRSLVTSRKELEQIPIQVNLNEVSNKSDDTMWMHRQETSGGGGTGEMWEVLEDMGRIKILKPHQMKIDIPEMNGVAITNMGFVDNRLHIQTKWEKNDKDRHGYFYLVNQEGEKIQVKENNFDVVLDDDYEVDFGGTHMEYILDIDKEEIKGTQLMGYFAENGEVINGEWNLEIDLNSNIEIIRIPCDIQKKTWKIEEMVVSSLGVALRGKGDKPTVDRMKCSIEMKNGVIKNFDEIHSSNQLGELMIKLIVHEPLNISEIESVQVDQDVIKIN